MLTGFDAIEYAEAHGLPVNKYTDPEEGARRGISTEEAREIAAEDPSLIWIEEGGTATPGDRDRVGGNWHDYQGRMGGRPAPPKLF